MPGKKTKQVKKITLDELPKSKRLTDHETYLQARKKNALISSVILGGQDGIVNVLGVLLAVASATAVNPSISNPASIVVIAGIAAAFTESVSMLAVAYTSARADEDYYKGEEEREMREISEMPEIEREEIRQLYFRKGFRGSQLENIVKTITKDKETWTEVMMREELGLEKVDLGYAKKEALIVGVSVVTGSLFPLLPFISALPQFGLTDIHGAIWIAAISSIGALFLAGFIKAKLTTGVPWKSGAEMALVAGTAAILSYIVGLLMRTIIP